jgi:hippurate hydrolase
MLRRVKVALVVTLSAMVALHGSMRAQDADLKAAVSSKVEQQWPELLELYKHFHANPELSFQEEKSAARVAGELSRAGYIVTTKVGGHGVVAVLRNGDGPTLLIRGDMDGLPVKEQTGLPYASTARATEQTGQEVDVMHACGHDVHMTCLIGTGRLLAQLTNHWRGTALLIGQPAEERGSGARAMLNDGLYKRFPLPNHAIALHVWSEYAAGTIGYCPGYAMANVDSLDITIRGVGGHGAYPHTTKDPIILAAQTIVALQTIVSREIKPGEPAVVTVGSIHGGAKHNIIPDEVTLQLTLRSYTDEVRSQTIAAVRRIVNGIATAAGVPPDRMPEIKIKDEFTPALYNDPTLTARVTGVFKQWLGEGNVVERKPVMGGEDFGQFGRTEHKIPIFMFGVGTVTPESFKEAMKSGKTFPSVHSPFFAPDPKPTIQTGITAMTAAAFELLGKPGK